MSRDGRRRFRLKLGKKNPPTCARQDSPVNSPPLVPALFSGAVLGAETKTGSGAAGFPLFCPRFNQSLCASLTRMEAALSWAPFPHGVEFSVCRGGSLCRLFRMESQIQPSAAVAFRLPLQIADGGFEFFLEGGLSPTSVPRHFTLLGFAQR